MLTCEPKDRCQRIRYPLIEPNSNVEPIGTEVL
jgi:hypothetical protein